MLCNNCIMYPHFLLRRYGPLRSLFKVLSIGWYGISGIGEKIRMVESIITFMLTTMHLSPWRGQPVFITYICWFFSLLFTTWIPIGIQHSDAWFEEWEQYQKELNILLSSSRHDIYTILWTDLSVLRQFPGFLQVRTLSHGLSVLQPFGRSSLCHWRQSVYNQSYMPRRFFISCEEIISSSLSLSRSRAIR